MNKRITSCFLTLKAAALSTLFLFTAASTQAAQPQITGVTFGPGSDTLTITGTNLLGNTGTGVRLVTLSAVGSNTPPTVCSTPSIVSQSSTSIVVNLAACTPSIPPISGGVATSLPPGTYVVDVIFNDGGTAPFTISTTLVGAGTQTTMTFPYVTAAGGLDTTIVLSNVSLTPTSSGNPGACSIFLFTDSGGVFAFGPSIPAGGIYQNTVSALQAASPILAAQPPYQGYAMAACNFAAKGAAFVTGAQSFEVPVTYP